MAPHSTAGRIHDDAIGARHRVRIEDVGLALAQAEQVHDLDVVGQESIRDELPVAFPGYRLRAHHRRGGVPRGDETLER